MEVSHGRWLLISHLSRVRKRVELSTSIVWDYIHDLTALSFERLDASCIETLRSSGCDHWHMRSHACAKQWLLIRIQSDARPGMTL